MSNQLPNQNQNPPMMSMASNTSVTGGAPIMINNNSMPLSMAGSMPASGTTNTFILNPSNVGGQTGQPINTQQINHMIANSSLVNQQQQQQQPQQQQHVTQFQNQQQQQSQQNIGQPNQFSQTAQQPQMYQQQSMASLQLTPSTSSPAATTPSLAITNGFIAPPQQQQQQSTQHMNGKVEEETPKNEQTSEDQSVKPQVNPHPVVVLDRQRLQELVKEVDPNEQLEEEVEDILLNIADDFIESLVTTSCMISRHRKSTTLDVKDVQLALEKNWNMWIPGFGIDGVVGVFTGGALGQNAAASRLPKKCISTEAHKQRMALIRKSLKKI